MFTWLSGSKIKALRKKIDKQEQSIAEYILSFDRYSGKLPEYCTVQGGFCTSTGLMLWEKDLEHKYTYMNMRHCNAFYGIPYLESKKLIGKTDMELIEEFNKRSDQKSTFAEICIKSDMLTIKNKKLYRFWEIGYIGKDIMILDVKKQPLYNKKNQLKGTRGWATLLTDRECEVKTLIEIYLESGIARRIDKDCDNGSACYLITKQDNKFNRQFLK